jgi:5-methylcytosine-specific restriction endonuclease McrA
MSGVRPVTRRQVYERDEYRCVLCFERPPTGYVETGNYLTVDHILPQTYQGPNAAWNLVAMCSDCNTRKGSKLYLELIQLAELRFRQYTAEQRELGTRKVRSPGRLFHGDDTTEYWVETIKRWGHDVVVVSLLGDGAKV